jgi:hypothetical protein
LGRANLIQFTQEPFVDWHRSLRYGAPLRLRPFSRRGLTLVD